MKRMILMVSLMATSLYGELHIVKDSAFSQPKGQYSVHFLFDTDDCLFIAVDRDYLCYKIPSSQLSTELRQLTLAQLNVLLNHGYIQIKISDNWDVCLVYHHYTMASGPSCGPISGGLAWLAVQTVGFTAMFTTALVVNTALPGVGGVATAVLGGGSIGSWMAAQNVIAANAALWGFAIPWF